MAQTSSNILGVSSGDAIDERCGAGDGVCGMQSASEVVEVGAARA
jgi:hypothetical protein